MYTIRSLEETQQLEVERALVLANQGSVMWQLEKENKLIKGQMGSEDLSQCITAVCGVILPRLTPRSDDQVFSEIGDVGSLFYNVMVSIVTAYDSRLKKKNVTRLL